MCPQCGDAVPSQIKTPTPACPLSRYAQFARCLVSGMTIPGEMQGFLNMITHSRRIWIMCHHTHTRV